jgi:thymidylate kinase
VIANHTAVHDLDNGTVAAAGAPFTGYLATPDITVCLHTSPAELAPRMSAKPDQTRSDRALLDDSDLLRRLQHRYDQIAAADSTARHLQTTGRTPGELVDRIIAMLPALTVSG